MLRPKPNVLIAVQERSRKVGEVVQDVGKQCEMVRKGLEDVRVKNAEMDGKLETEIDRKEAEVEAGVRPTPNVERPILDTDELGPSKWASSTS